MINDLPDFIIFDNSLSCQCKIEIYCDNKSFKLQKRILCSEHLLLFVTTGVIFNIIEANYNHPDFQRL